MKKLLLLLVMAVVLVGCASQEKVKVLFRTTPVAAPNIYIDGKLIGSVNFNALTIDLKAGGRLWKKQFM